MSKIDYSQFYVRNYMQKSLPVKKQDTRSEPKKNRKSRKKALFFIVVIILVASLFAVNFLYEGKIFAGMRAWITNEKTEDFYLVTKSFQEREKAYAQSLLVRQSGAGGYIFQQEDYIVVYSVYLNEEDAKSVSAKNAQTKVLSKRILVKEALYEHICKTLRELVSAASQLEDGSIYEAKFLEICAVAKAGLVEQKQKLYKEKTASDEYISLLDLLTGGLSALDTPSPSRTKLIGDLRYVITSALINMPAL
ncbi:MAG: hypothetical protein PHC84_03995 [Clostridia bacterium]|nr:hypothetical protein [Clostridia bacterium]